MTRFHGLPRLVDRRTLEHDGEKDAEEPDGREGAEGEDGIAEPSQLAEDAVIRDQDGYLDGRNGDGVAQRGPIYHLNEYL